MPTIFPTEAANHWVEVPAWTQGPHEKYYFILTWPYDANAPAQYEKPPDEQCLWDRLWKMYKSPAGRYFFYNEVSRQSKWHIPGVVQQAESGMSAVRPAPPAPTPPAPTHPAPTPPSAAYPSRTIGRFPVLRERQANEWPLERIQPVAGLWPYEPNIEESAPPTCSEDSSDAPGDHSGWVLVKANGGEDYAWNLSTGEVAKSLPPGVVPYYTAWPEEVPDPTTGSTRLAYYYVNAAGNAIWDPLEPGDASDTQDEEWLKIGGVVRITGLQGELERLEGLHATVSKIDPRHVSVVLPAFYGPRMYELEKQYVQPLRVGSFVRMGDGWATVDRYDAEVETPYLVRDHSGQYTWARSTDLKPFTPQHGVNLQHPVHALSWKEKLEQAAIFFDAQAKHHTFYVSLPIGWAQYLREGSTRPWPLLVQLNGAGVTGCFLGKTKKSTKSTGMQFAAEHFVVVSPECPWKWDQTPEDWVLQLVETFRACSWIDPNRIYLTGCSMGGMGTWHYASTRPDLFAAVAPIAGYVLPGQEVAITRELVKMPILVGASLMDETCAFEAEVPVYHSLLEAGCQTLAVYLHPSSDHQHMWSYAYCETAFLYKWLLAHRKD